MKRIMIKEKLSQIDYSLDRLSLGDFDQIGELTAKKNRMPNDPLYKSAGCFFRSNYERGMLIYSLIRRFEIKTFFEVGFGRGFSAFCAAKAMCDAGFDDGKIYSLDVNIDEDFLRNLTRVFPKEWFSKIDLIRGTTNDALANVSGPFELVSIDGDHRYPYVKNDWTLLSKQFTKFLLFAGYNEELSSTNQIKQLVDELEHDKELIITDRRIFFDDRRLSDDDVKEGHVLIKHPEFDDQQFVTGW